MKFLIYGATKGRGDGLRRTVALSLLKKGHDVSGLCRDKTKADAEREFPLQALDLLTEMGPQRVKELIRENDPDVIWSTCGTGYATPLWSMPEAEIEEMLDANIRKTVAFCKICAPSCVNGGPHLVLTGSVVGVLEGVGTSVYSGMKGFLVPFVRGQRNEYKRQGHKPRISLLLLQSVRLTEIDVVVDALEFIGRQSSSLEILVS
ncbi:MAG: SDR family oxidoreductase [Candidatus Hydrogenedentes bacterium]|nr:SDR family oxidoreductase [Candidatus Hydrogenedentota bacterium]